MQQPHAKPKPRLGFWQIWNLSFGFLGIQFGFALQNANVSRIFETLGARPEEIPILWLAAPVTGLIVQPIIGFMSDRTWHPYWGRRRPFFLIGAILASLALVVMPNSAVLWVAAGTLWMMDASINISMEPFRAFVGDMLPEEQTTRGFAMQSFFIGIGAVVASMLPYVLSNVLGVANTAPEGEVPPSVKWSFYLGAIAFLTAVAWTVFTTREYPPEGDEPKPGEEPLVIRYSPRFYASVGLGLLVLAVVLAYVFHLRGYKQELYVLSGILGLFGLAYAVSSIWMSRGLYRNGFVQIVRDFQNMPRTMIDLAFVQFFSWFALFAMWIYTTSAVTLHVFGSNDPSSKAYNEGADWVGVCFAVYNGVAAAVALLLPELAKRTSRRFTHMLALMSGGLGLVSIYFIKEPNMLLLSMVGVGIAWASILSIPYAMLAGCLPANKMGYYMGIFNFFIVIPQIVAASLLGFMVERWFAGSTVHALIAGGVCMGIAGLLTLRVHDRADVRLPI
ncbi:MFS transporter [bacterium]|nr:MFS transporter [bacterium]